jgi:hypothetical protein
VNCSPGGGPDEHARIRLGNGVSVLDRGGCADWHHRGTARAWLRCRSRCANVSRKIERTEEARGEASERLDELKYSGTSHREARRARVVEALNELDDARHNVVTALSPGEPSLSDG